MKAAANSNSGAGASIRSEGVAADAASNCNDSGASVKTKKSLVRNKHEHEQSSPKTDEAFAVGGKPDFFLTLVEGGESDSISISDDVKNCEATAAAAIKSGVSAGSLGSNHSAHLDEDEQISPQTDEGFAVGGRPDFFFDIAAGNRESESSSGDDKPSQSIMQSSKEAGIIQSVATAAVSVGSLGLGLNDSAHPDADEHERNSHLTDENVDVGDFDFLINAVLHENESSSGDDKSYSIQKASKEASTSIQSVAAQTIRDREKVDYALPMAKAEHSSVDNVSVKQPQSTSSNKDAVNMSSNQMPNLNTLTLGLENDDESNKRGGINEDKDFASGSIILCSCSVCYGKERQKTCLFA
eukprot:scaffold7068_cov107-Skeletonema_dohrnii-CCMP3373.AAC.3